MKHMGFPPKNVLNPSQKSDQELINIIRMPYSKIRSIAFKIRFESEQIKLDFKNVQNAGISPELLLSSTPSFIKSYVEDFLTFLSLYFPKNILVEFLNPQGQLHLQDKLRERGSKIIVLNSNLDLDSKLSYNLLLAEKEIIQEIFPKINKKSFKITINNLGQAVNEDVTENWKIVPFDILLKILISNNILKEKKMNSFGTMKS
ncbi:MAG: hypothetical protein RBG13Loki_0794 [Promethearchaeota archaeon CR_4]|nr:MAG: hypothetical protein RBG13Loki_0794 [Candidatus Lokiarchaeota archaeon CR_4]